MRGDKEIAGAYGVPAADLAINFKAGLFRIRNRTVAIRVTVSNGSRSSSGTKNAMGDHFAGPEKSGGDLCRRRHTRYRYERVLVQFIYGALCASAIRRQICILENGRTLWIRDEQER